MEEYNSNFTQIEQKIETLKSKSVSDFVELYNQVENDMVEQKNMIREELMPKNKQEDERIREIADKIHLHIQTGLETYKSIDDMLNYLEPAFQRGKVDKTYGRALVLLEENTIIEQIKHKFKDDKDNVQLIILVLDKFIELSIEIMPNSYSNILELEQTYFKVYYDNM
ncbi:hypothetical protein [Staphylococcus pseudoxylosus]|uniref:Uncharacterized protein n=1 Tax=Staphylococcus pseudoxylosus TaxID=2282419 RepID=A0AAQ0S7C7_9STAP|nr:hypothetical protein [Staphylococcus pseudoxylosus]PTI79519.1 hypothetical protein BU098_14175 [Staphylococcus xylosus]MBM2658106.1 hypothetical protein [Staphylococcus pseudoxylosus]MDW8546182.1 hypothetical protein [Staphylococcus pseudoxylosus]MEB5782968.1 hypothetical protein [Staphylococcus pseudoxylosus]MEB6170542.1 hypothetical protein [Staphylococcus pseudoxylosus]